MFHNDELWWNNITNARNLLEEIYNHILTGTLYYLFVPDDMPWRHSLRKRIRNVVGDILDIDVIDVQDEKYRYINYVSVDDFPETFMIDRYCDNQYSTTTGMTSAEYIYKAKKLQYKDRKVLWLKGFSCFCDIQSWVQYYEKNNEYLRDNWCFLFEINEEFSEIAGVANKSMHYDRSITQHDVMLFCSMIIDNVWQDITIYNRSEWAHYIASLVAHLCDNDVEIANELIKDITNTIQYNNVYDPNVLSSLEDDSALYSKDALFPMYYLENISSRYERRGVTNKKHILYLVRNKSNDDNIFEIKRRIWMAQLEAFFPRIEQFRIDIIRTYQDKFDEFVTNMNEEGVQIASYPKEHNSPFDIDLNTLCRHVNYNKLNFIPLNIKQMIRDITNIVRNELAHGTPISLKGVNTCFEILKGYGSHLNRYI